jgi:hypothetical protein
MLLSVSCLVWSTVKALLRADQFSSGVAGMPREELVSEGPAVEQGNEGSPPFFHSPLSLKALCPHLTS